jgi:putative SOS response-associated peptidase YedK
MLSKHVSSGAAGARGTTTIDVLRLAASGPELVPMRWGLIPGWWKKTAKEVPSTFNVRAETVAEKPMFRSAFKRTRCIVPASGYYEWRTRGGWPLGSMERPSNRRDDFERHIDRHGSKRFHAVHS